jgi:hypothetical protein
MTAYFDESGTHDESAVTVMGGVIATARQWERFDKGFSRAKRRHGFRVFHTKKFKRRSGDFKGWTNEQCLALIADLAPLTATVTEGIAISLDNAAFQVEYKSGEKPRKVRLDTEYGLCLRMCLYHLVREALKREFKGKFPHVRVVLEAGHRHYGDAERVFNEVKAELEGLGCYVLKAITKAEKDECDPLMMADFVSHMTYLSQTKPATEQPGLRFRPVPRGQTGVTHLWFSPGGLAQEKAELVAATKRD